MWFKRLQVWHLTQPIAYRPQELADHLAQLSFQGATPAMMSHSGFVSPLQEDHAPLVHGANGFMMFCMQVEEKILPAGVIKQALDEKIKALEAESDRKIRGKAKLALKDDITIGLLPRAFSKMQRVHVIIDTKNNLLLIDNTSSKLLDNLFGLCIKAIPNFDAKRLKTKDISRILTSWVMDQTEPNSITVLDSCVLQDPDQQSRVIRAKQQDLTAKPIQQLIVEGCEITQLLLQWQERAKFTLTSELTLQNIRFEDSLLAEAKDEYAETKADEFAASFIIMIETLNHIVTELLKQFLTSDEEATDEATA